MCIIMAKPAGVKFPKDDFLEEAARRNRDGIGLAYTHEGLIRIKKDFNDLDAVKKFIRENIKIEQAVLIHFRIGTAGLDDCGNRHPFPLTSRRKRLRAFQCVTDIAVAHNGTLKDFTKHKKYSDTLLFIKDVLSDPIIRNNIHSPAIQELIDGYLGTSKMAIMDRLGNIIKLGTFHLEEGVYYSNESYKPWVSNYAVNQDAGAGGGFDSAYQRSCEDCKAVCSLYYMVYTETAGWLCGVCKRKATYDKIAETETYSGYHGVTQEIEVARRRFKNNRQGD